jgi:hypothetical protein
MTKGAIVVRDPVELRVHPLARGLPDWPARDARFEALLADLRERGQDQPLLITADNQILDGRKRWRMAGPLQWPELECRVVPEQHTTQALLASLVQRKQYTKGALAYVAFPLMEPAWEEARHRKMAMLKRGTTSPSSIESTTGKTIEAFAAMLGFCRDLFFQARQIHGLFLKHPKLKAEFEPRIIEDEIGLGACLAGIAGKLGSEDKSPQRSRKLELLIGAFATAGKRFGYWAEFDGEARAVAARELNGLLDAIPPEALALARKLKKEVAA